MNITEKSSLPNAQYRAGLGDEATHLRLFSLLKDRSDYAVIQLQPAAKN